MATSTGTAWAVSGEGRLFATTDGGGTWTAQPVATQVVDIAEVGRWLWALSCTPTGAAPCRPVLERTPLTGGAWQTLPLPQLEVFPPMQLVVATADVAVLLVTVRGTPATLVTTTDGGTQWNVDAAPAGPGGLCSAGAGLTAAGANDWWYLCFGSGAAGSATKALMRTVDGGRTWTTVSAVTSLQTPMPSDALTFEEVSALAAGSSDRLWLAGQNALTESADGGATWADVAGASLGGSLTTFDVLSPSNAWLLSPGGGLWATTDGSTWHALGASATAP